MTTENDFIRRLARRFPLRPPVEVGIGDDGAVLICGREHATDQVHFAADRMVVVTDMLLDGVHFELDKISPSLAGRKAVAVNLSDLAAMACFPTAAFVSIAIPKTMRMPGGEFLDELYGGIESLTKQYDFTLAGGDTNSWNGPFAINVCLTGSPMKDRPLLRSGARPGDHLFVTGPLGGSLQSGRHLTFEPRLDLARWLVELNPPNAMMDLSDGLSVDLARMMEASNTGAVLRTESIPIHEDVPESLPRPDRTQAALADGEDFELLISVSENDSHNLTWMAREAGISLYKVGKVAQQKIILIQDDSGHVHELKGQGWIHQWK
jgi:thiamine-monophosphate kinase